MFEYILSIQFDLFLGLFFCLFIRFIQLALVRCEKKCASCRSPRSPHALLPRCHGQNRHVWFRGGSSSHPGVAAFSPRAWEKSATAHPTAAQNLIDDFQSSNLDGSRRVGTEQVSPPTLVCAVALTRDAGTYRTALFPTALLFSYRLQSSRQKNKVAFTRMNNSFEEKTRKEDLQNYMQVVETLGNDYA